VNEALFLDLDGTLIEHQPYLHWPDKVVVIPEHDRCATRDAGDRLSVFSVHEPIGHWVHGRLLALLGFGPDLSAEIFIGRSVRTNRPNIGNRRLALSAKWSG